MTKRRNPKQKKETRSNETDTGDTTPSSDSVQIQSTINPPVSSPMLIWIFGVLMIGWMVYLFVTAYFA